MTAQEHLDQAQHYLDIAIVFWKICLCSIVLNILIEIGKPISAAVRDWRHRKRLYKTRGPYGLYYPAKKGR